MVIKKTSSFRKGITSILSAFGFVPKAVLGSGSEIVHQHLFTFSYNGEKNLGEAGPLRNYVIDYDVLRMRSWQALLESEVVQTVIGRYKTWVIGPGLKLQSEPPKLIFETEGIDINLQDFSKMVEARFGLYRQSQCSDYSGMENLDLLSGTAFVNSIVGGDVLVILRYVDGYVKIQLIDGAHIQSPVYGTEYYPQTMPNGNRIIHGIEIDKTGKHIRYYVRRSDYSIVPIEARGSTGLQTAFLVYGLKYRLNNLRGLPLISAVIESLKKMERYKEATLGSAEERQKIAFFIKHEMESTGENPLSKSIARAINVNKSRDLPTTDDGKVLADKVAATMNKAVFNMPQGSELKGLESKNELYFKDFYSVNIDLICAALQIPPNVAMSKYDSNFSASRAALKDWENTLNVKRKEFAFAFMQPIYNFFLEIEILNNRITAPGYLSALLSGDMYLLEAYRNARFIGMPVPHIDPLKEVKAEREKLGSRGADLPLTTLEAATENLGGGESRSNMEQFSDELETADELEILAAPVIPNVATPPPAKPTGPTDPDQEE